MVEPVAEPTYASVGDRLLAQILDLVLAFSVFFFTGMSLAPRLGGRTQGGFNLEGWPAVIALTVTALPVLAYFVLTEGLFGASLGKVVAGIRVQRIAGGRIGLGPALVRNLLRLIDGTPFYIPGALLVIVTKRRQRLGDLAAGSVVVRRETPAVARLAALIAVLLLAAAGFAGGFRLGGPPPAGPRAEAVRSRAVPSDVWERLHSVASTDRSVQVLRLL